MTWGWFNIKMSSNQYRKCHCGDKTILRSSYLHNGISYTGKMTCLYWIRAWLLVPPSHQQPWHWPCSITHWGRVTHICVSNLTIIGSDNGLSPGRRQAIIWTNAGMLLIGPLGTNFNNEILLQIHTFSFNKIHFKMSPGKWRPFCLGLNVITKSLSSMRKYLIYPQSDNLSMLRNDKNWFFFVLFFCCCFFCQ